MERLGVIAVSVREGRRGFAFAQWLHEVASARPNVEAQLIIESVVDDRGMPTLELVHKKAGIMLDELIWLTGVMREARAAKLRG